MTWTVRRLAAEVVDGLSAEQLNAELNELQTKGPLWQPKVKCLRSVSITYRRFPLAWATVAGWVIHQPTQSLGDDHAVVTERSDSPAASGRFESGGGAQRAPRQRAPKPGWLTAEAGAQERSPIIG